MLIYSNVFMPPCALFFKMTGAFQRRQLKQRIHFEQNYVIFLATSLVITKFCCISQHYGRPDILKTRWRTENYRLKLRFVNCWFILSSLLISASVSCLVCSVVICSSCRYTVSQKRPTIFSVHNFAKYLPIFTVLLSIDSARNLQ